MTLDELLPEIRREVAGCPDTTLKYALVRAARRFCAETWFVKRTLIGSTVADQAMYPLVGPNVYEQNVALKLAQITPVDGSIRPLAFAEPESIDPNQDTGLPSRVVFLPYQNIVLSPTPNAVYSITLTVVVQPIMGATVFADELSVKWYQVIAAGALAWLQRMAKEPWFNERDANLNESIFKSGIANAKGEAANSMIPGGQRIRPRSFIV